MRILIKGGVWKNTEDEILKAAVMKYGLNQWSRISSLLTRKSAKQCKARWYEWLDPAIKKTEWTREEDEKLLHLAKLMPTQWRTIAPIVGRTPAQCLERYERLLDMAAGKEGGYDPRDDPRRLRPGEIDPNPETKPARPDPVDMDEDEKEMLSEARARLANTKGKKAKRKAREKQLEEARRLATLQKQRELKAAGIEVREKVKRGMGVDYAKEVPFEHRPAPGFYDTVEEGERTKEIQEDFRPILQSDLEGRKRRDLETEMAKKDAARRKAAERNNLPAAVARAMAAAEAAAGPSRRGKMMLPAPQVSDAELEALARQGDGALDMEALAAGGSEATRALIGEYATPARFATPMRTPAAPSGGDRVMLEAQNLRRLQQGQTPLLGGENPDLNASDFSGVTPRPAPAATPNPLAAAAAAAAASRGGATGGHTGRRSIAGVSATPLLTGATPSRDGGTATASAMPTPMRDALGLNDTDIAAAADRHEAALRAAMARNELRSSIAQLPAPRNEYQIAAPDVVEDGAAAGEMEGQAMEIEDAEEERARRKAEAAAAAEADFRRRSRVLQRGLPRPVMLDGLAAPKSDADALNLHPLAMAEEMVHREMLLLLRHDAKAHPLNPGRDVPGVAPLPGPGDADMAAARELLEAEIAVVREAMGHAQVPVQDYIDTWQSVAGSLLFVPSHGRYMPASAVAPKERAAALQAEFEGLRREMEREAKRAAKIEQKAAVVTGGLAARQEKLRDDLESASKELVVASIELACFKALHEQEERAAPERMEEVQGLVAEQAQREASLQKRYAEALRRRDEGVKQQPQMV